MQHHNKRLQENLEVPVEYVFNGNDKVLQWAKKSVDDIDANVNKKTGRCLKQKFVSFI